MRLQISLISSGVVPWQCTQLVPTWPQADAQEVARRRVEVVRGRGETDLVAKEFVVRVFPAFRFHDSAPFT